MIRRDCTESTEMESDYGFCPHFVGSLPDCTEEVGSEQDESEEEVAIEEEATARQEEDFGVEYLLKQDEDREGEGENDSAPAPGPKKEITDIAAAAESLQPKGYTLATTQVSYKEIQLGR